MGESLSTHEDYMRMALALAKRGEGNVSPNHGGVCGSER